MKSKTYGFGLRFEAFATEDSLLDGQPIKAGQVLAQSPTFWEPSDDELFNEATADFEGFAGALAARGLPASYWVAVMLRGRGESET